MRVDTTAGVFAVQCPKCRKFMLVEQKDAEKVVNCLLCKNPIQVGTAPPAIDPQHAVSAGRPAGERPH